MNILFVSNSSSKGGAAVVTTRLMEQLASMGHSTAMLEVAEPSHGSIHRLGNPLSRNWKFLSERLRIFLANGFSRRDLFKVSVASSGFDIARHRLIREADAVILGWINQGVLSLDDISRLAAMKPVIWVMHDMWCMTGACHHAHSCGNYRNECGHCPYFREGRNGDDLSRRCHILKKALYETCRGRLHFVAVSNWLAGKARESTLLDDKDITVIHNPFPESLLYRGAVVMPEVREVVMCAARLDDPIKNLPLAIEAINRVREPVRLVLVGDLRDRTLLDRIKVPYKWHGVIRDPERMSEIYSRASVVLSTSRFETLPGTIIEGMAAGCMAVATDRGGQRDIITDSVNGYLTDEQPATIAAAIERALSSPRDRALQAADIAARHGATAVAAQFLQLIERVKR